MPKEGDIGTAPDGSKVIFRGGKVVPYQDQAGLEILGGNYRRNQVGKVYREGPRGGFEQVGGPNDTMVKGALESATGVNRALSGLDRVDQQLRSTKTIGPFGLLTNPTDLKVLEQSVRDLQLRLKEQPYNLGVLNGPDLMLIEQIVADPSKLKNAAFRQTIIPRLANLASILGEQYRSEAEQFAAMGGRKEAIPPLFQSPRSQYTKEQYGREGRLPPRTTPGAPKAGAASPPARGAKAMSDAEIKAALGL